MTLNCSLGWSCINYACMLLIINPLQNQCSNKAGLADPCIEPESTVAKADKQPLLASKFWCKHCFITKYEVHNYLIYYRHNMQDFIETFIQK